MVANVEPKEQSESPFEDAEAPGAPSASPAYGLIGQVTNLLGRTAGSVLSAGQQAGRLLQVPSRFRSLVSAGSKRRQEREFEAECLRGRIEGLYARIGERVCHSPLIDRSILSKDPQLEALVSTVRDLEVKAMDLQLQDHRRARGSHPPEPDGSLFADKGTGPYPAGRCAGCSIACSASGHLAAVKDRVPGDKD